MLDIRKDIHPVTDFKRRTAEFVKRIKARKRPVILTVNGKAELVVQDAGSYQKLLDRLERLETVAAIRKGLQDAEEGRIRDARGAFEELRTKLALPR